MLPEEENNTNKIEQSEPLLNQKIDIKLWKRICLFVVGLGGLYLISFFVSIFVILANPPEDLRDPIVTLRTYGILFLGLIAFVIFDIPKFLPDFKKWKPYVFGLAAGVAIILFDMFYTSFVSMFYTYSVGDNEKGIRSIIELYPIAAIIILGIVGPLCEELTYRVGLFGALRKWHRVPAYIISVLIFGLIHFNALSANIYDELVNLPVYTLSGLALAFVYDKWGFASSATAHITNNLYAIIMNIILRSIH